MKSLDDFVFLSHGTIIARLKLHTRKVTCQSHSEKVVSSVEHVPIFIYNQTILMASKSDGRIQDQPCQQLAARDHQIELMRMDFKS